MNAVNALKMPVVFARHRNTGVIVAIVSVALLVIILHAATYQVPDPKPEVYVTKGLTEIDNVQIEQLKADPLSGGSEGGSPMDGPVNTTPPTPQIAQTPTSSKGKTSVPKGDGTITYKPTDKPSPKPYNPFSKPGANGNGKGTSYGNAEGNGTGVGVGGPGSGTGPGDGAGAKPRARISTPTDDEIVSDENCKVVFNIVYNANGDVISAQPIIGSCTTTNMNIIAQAKQAILKDLKYAALAGAPDIKQRFSINISAK